MMIEPSKLVLFLACITLGSCLQVSNDSPLKACYEICGDLFDGCLGGNVERVAGAFCNLYCNLRDAHKDCEEKEKKLDEAKGKCTVLFGCSNCTKIDHTTAGYPEPVSCKFGGKCRSCRYIDERWAELKNKLAKNRFTSRKECGTTKEEVAKPNAE